MKDFLTKNVITLTIIALIVFLIFSVNQCNKNQKVIKEYKGYNLVGFFRTSAIIAITEQPVIGYPSFKELYGDLRPTPGQAIGLPKDGIKELRDKVFDNTILQAFIPIVSRECSKVTTLFNH